MSPRLTPVPVLPGQVWSLCDHFVGRFRVRVESVKAGVAYCTRLSTGYAHAIRVSTLSLGLRGATVVDAETPEPTRPSRRTRPLAEQHAHSRIVTVTDEMRRAWRLRHEDGLSCVVIGQRLGISRAAAARWVKAADEERARKVMN